METRFRILAISFFVAMILSSAARGAGDAKLPYAAGERFIVSTGYDTPPTHVKKDSYAIDFTQNGCDAYGKFAVAANSGTAWIVSETGYNGGYGTQLLVANAGNIITRYAHLIPGSIPLAAGDAVPQGTVVGEIGDTGFVAGNACAIHPGTHIHFAMDAKNGDGSFTAEDPEPLSGYADITAGRWYVSDNALAATIGNLAAIAAVLRDLLNGVTYHVGVTDTPMLGTLPTDMPSSTPSSSPIKQAFVSGAASDAPPLSSPAANLPPEFLSSNENTIVSVPGPNFASSATVQAPAGGGIRPGGVSMSGGPMGTSLTPATSMAIPVVDDPADDSVAACQ